MVNEVVTIKGNVVTLDEWSAEPGKMYFAETPSGKHGFVFTKDGYLEIYQGIGFWERLVLKLLWWVK